MQVRTDTSAGRSVCGGQPSRVHEVYARFVKEMLTIPPLPKSRV